MKRSRKDRLTPKGKKLLKILKHLRIASAVADGRVEPMPGQMSDEAVAAEADAIRIMSNMIKAKYLTREARRVRARGR